MAGILLPEGHYQSARSAIRESQVFHLAAEPGPLFLYAKEVEVEKDFLTVMFFEVGAAAYPWHMYLDYPLRLRG